MTVVVLLLLLPVGTTEIPKTDRFSGALGGHHILLRFFTAYEMVTPALVATCRVACRQSSKYICSVSGLSDTDFNATASTPLACKLRTWFVIIATTGSMTKVIFPGFSKAGTV